jgi:glycosyltransferase involved in cell wall biosynthesis
MPSLLLTHAYILLIFSLALEVAALWFTSYGLRRILYIYILLLVSFSGSLLIFTAFSFLSLMVGFVCIYRILNCWRVLAGKTHERHNVRTVRKTSVYLIAYQALTLAFFVLLDKYFSWTEWVVFLMIGALIVQIVMIFATRNNLRGTAWKEEALLTKSELPSISVCIPARNETHDLTKCLSSLLKSDYHKLEILVLDDCSQDKTSEIIKSFAHKGVRFIAGDMPKSGWLAKNQAYQMLTEAASGEILIFCGVDVRFERQSLHYIVTRLISRNKKMVSVLPQNYASHKDTVTIQSQRYWWELALPRRLFKRPPTLSTCWAIYADSLRRLGSFKSVGNTVLPEAYFAGRLKVYDAYSFLRSSGEFKLYSAKSFSEQWQTALRIRYPQVRKRVEIVALLTAAEILFLLLPFIIFIIGFFIPLSWLWLLAGLTISATATIHYMVTWSCKLPYTHLQLALMPISLLLEIFLLHASMWKYEFGTMLWKERNICIPVMHAIPRLPEA